jgi:hAT family C-terminal dimerisation region
MKLLEEYLLTSKRLPNTDCALEVEFLQYKVAVSSYKTMDVTNFWRANSTRFPKLAKLAQVLFMISPTSIECERAFSAQELS